MRTSGRRQTTLRIAARYRLHLPRRVRREASDDARSLLDAPPADLPPVLTLAIGVAIWEAVVRINEIPDYVLPAPSVVFATLVQDWSLLFGSLLTTLLTTLQGFVAACGRRYSAGNAVQPLKMARIRAVSLCGDPAGHAGNCDRAFAADLFTAASGCRGLCVDRRFFSGVVQHHLGSEVRGPQFGRVVRALWCVANTDPAVSEIAFCTAAYHAGGRRSAGGLSLIGAVVAEIAAGLQAPVPALPTGLPNPATGSTFLECSRRCCCCPLPGLSFIWPSRSPRILCYDAGTKVRSERIIDVCKSFPE